MTKVGIDPGLKQSGIAIETPQTPLTVRTLRLKDSPGTMCDYIIDEITSYPFHLPGIVAIEAYTHRPYLKRVVTNAAEMGALVGVLRYRLEVLGFTVIEILAEESKRNLPVNDHLAWKKFGLPGKNSHERSAYAVLASIPKALSVGWR